MSVNRDGGLSANGKKFSELLKETMADYDDYDESQRRPVDYSFLYAVSEAAIERGLSGKAMLRIVAGILIFCMTVTGAAVWLSSDTAFAGRIKKIFYQLTNGLFTTDPTDEYFEESVNIFKIETMDDIGKSKKFLPELSTPQYIPQGYKFVTLEITKYISNGNYIVQYNYSAGSKSIEINMKMVAGENAIAPENNTIAENDLIMWEDSQGVNAIKGSISISITGDVSADEMFEIIKSLS